MKLASLKGGRDGMLAVVSRHLETHVTVPDVAPTLQSALDRWSLVSPQLQAVSEALNQGSLQHAMPFDPARCMAPLPRAYQWADGSAYVGHVELMRKARGVPMPERFWSDPLIYQGGSDSLLGPMDDILCADESFGIDLEAEIAVITDDVPMGVQPARAAGHIRLLMLLNDVSLRGLIPGELEKGFGFFQSKPATSFSPVAVTPDELGTAWHDGRVHLPLHAYVNGVRIGSPEAGEEMTFSFPQLIAHAARTRELEAGTIIGSGTVSNRDRSRGSCCLHEIRMLEVLAGGAPKTPFLSFGDRVRIEMTDAAGRSIFGAIDQRVVQLEVEK
ncbi:MAG: fumarylacetoacetate hydrolase family protein [Alphaproteobacteria bacterium]|nr:fumarylacetoacetate hydrolase family protein [Alphaproteobacteria bacterium]